MKKFLFLLALALSFPLYGQDYLMKTFYGQGNNREAALESLLASLGTAVSFQHPRLLETYRDAISRAAVEQDQHGTTMLLLSGTTLDGIFQARQTRTANILDEGRKATDPAIRMTYYRWGWYYLCSLPFGHQLPGKEELLQWIQAHPEVQPGRLGVPMTHIEREVEQIRRIVGAIPAPEKKPVASVRELPAPDSPPRTGESPAEHRERPVTAISSLPRPAFLSHEPEPASGPIPLRHALPEPPQPSPLPWRTSLLLTAGRAPEPVWGATVALGRQWGVILAFQSDFHGRKTGAYAATSDGRIVGSEGFLWPNGTSACAHLRLTAGVSYALFPWMEVYAGAGYGYRTIWWQDQDENWARMKDRSARGLALSGGALFHYKHLCAQLDAGTITFQTLGVSLGLGITF